MYECINSTIFLIDHMNCLTNLTIPISYYKKMIDMNINPNKRKKFTPQEDETLKLMICRYGSMNWKLISTFLPGRTPKQCKDRYVNYLSQYISQEPWKKEEDEILLMYLSLIGTKWVEISRHIPGRSGNNVKNRWYRHLCKFYTLTPCKGDSLINCVEIKKKEIPQELQTEITENNTELNYEIDESNIESNYEFDENKYSISSLLV